MLYFQRSLEARREFFVSGDWNLTTDETSPLTHGRFRRSPSFGTPRKETSRICAPVIFSAVASTRAKKSS